MINKEKTAVAVANNPDVAEKLNSLLACPNDRAYIICTQLDCSYNIKGECTIFAVIDEVARGKEEPCTRYVKEV